MAGIKRVLIVEDEQTIRDSLFELFDVEGVEAVSAATLPEARSELLGRRWDLIVTDIRLGAERTGGLQITALAGFVCPDARVVVLTAYPDGNNRHASGRLGATHFLEKPVGLDRIATLARRYGIASAVLPLTDT